jgi:hydrogenase 3 maturation protease
MSSIVEQEIKKWFSDAKKVVIAGIGNPIRSDDFVGLKIVEDLKGKVSANVCLLECETVPESFISDIAEFKPSHVLLVDAAFLKLEPGEFRFVQSSAISSFPAVSTHLLPLRIFCDLVNQSTGAKIALVLVEPGNVEFGEGLTCEVSATAEKISTLLLGLFGTKK